MLRALICCVNANAASETAFRRTWSRYIGKHVYIERMPRVLCTQKYSFLFFLSARLLHCILAFQCVLTIRWCVFLCSTCFKRRTLFDLSLLIRLFSLLQVPVNSRNFPSILLRKTPSNNIIPKLFKIIVVIYCKLLLFGGRCFIFEFRQFEVATQCQSFFNY